MVALVRGGRQRDLAALGRALDIRGGGAAFGRGDVHGVLRIAHAPQLGTVERVRGADHHVVVGVAEDAQTVVERVAEAVVGNGADGHALIRGGTVGDLEQVEAALGLGQVRQGLEVGLAGQLDQHLVQALELVGNDVGDAEERVRDFAVVVGEIGGALVGQLGAEVVQLVVDVEELRGLIGGAGGCQAARNDAAVLDAVDQFLGLGGGQADRLGGRDGLGVGGLRLRGGGVLAGLDAGPVDQRLRIVGGRHGLGGHLGVLIVALRGDGGSRVGRAHAPQQAQEHAQVVDGVVPILLVHVENVTVGELCDRFQQGGGVHGGQVHLALVNGGLPGVLVHVVVVAAAQTGGTALREGVVLVAHEHLDVLVLVHAV